ncbi:PREDICTED: von Hippel-Lindau tumor suppressor homolog [Polistes dominula]|uniref:von Hippel-Lindau tumor suppressor homolog n=1 Tax=Polistes dominula TaxID=743375 RepID=A0ABM1J821_POLDO|nr:PREDICTED: von Hippel-Lindau tumor suppressor homolog [Polistes dominula]
MAQNEEPFLRSTVSQQVSYVRFTNYTKRIVDLYWIDFQGIAIKYGSLTPDQYLEINTYATHPWICVDAETKERYWVNNKEVFYPEPWIGKCVNNEQYILRLVNRIDARILTPMYSLVELSARAITRCLQYREQVNKLNLPRCLENKLFSMLPNELTVRLLNRKKEEEDS